MVSHLRAAKLMQMLFIYLFDHMYVTQDRYLKPKTHMNCGLIESMPDLIEAMPKVGN